MDWIDVVRACFSPKEFLHRIRMCRNEGCSFKEAIALSAISISWDFGEESISDELSARLERSLWIAEHPGCTKEDVNTWEREQLEEAMEECRSMLRIIKGR